jgi:hypothetical protein
VSCRLLSSEVRVPRLDPAPRRKRGAGFKTRGKKAASVGRRLRADGVSSGVCAWRFPRPDCGPRSRARAVFPAPSLVGLHKHGGHHACRIHNVKRLLAIRKKLANSSCIRIKFHLLKPVNEQGHAECPCWNACFDSCRRGFRFSQPPYLSRSRACACCLVEFFPTKIAPPKRPPA